MRYPGPKTGDELEPLALLDPRQVTALQHLLAGRTVKEAAEAADVHRATVHRWQRNDLAFRAVYNRRLYELQQAAIARVHRMAQTALDQLEEDLEEGKLTTSEKLRFLESVGILDGELPVPGPVSTGELARESLDRLAEETSPESVREWVALVDEQAERGAIPSDGSYRGIRATIQKQIRALEEAELPKEVDWANEELEGLLPFLEYGITAEALLEWQGVLEELRAAGGDRTGASAMAFWLTVGRLLTKKEQQSETSQNETLEARKEGEKDKDAA